MRIRQKNVNVLGKSQINNGPELWFHGTKIGLGNSTHLAISMEVAGSAICQVYSAVWSIKINRWFETYIMSHSMIITIHSSSGM